MRVRDYGVRHNGLLRCCRATLEQHGDEDVEIGATLHCGYEDGDEPTLELAPDGTWQWAAPGKELTAYTEAARRCSKRFIDDPEHNGGRSPLLSGCCDDCTREVAAERGSRFR